jgi:HEAT repeat protein
MKKHLAIGMAGIVLAVMTAPLYAQEGKWVETRFERVHLRNGNFIDGHLIRESEKLVILDVVGGEMAIRKDMIERNSKGNLRVELVKMRSYKEAPRLAETTVPRKPLAEIFASAEAPVAASVPSEVVTLTGTVAEQLEQAKAVLKEGSPARKQGAIEALTKAGPEAAPFLAELLAVESDDLLPGVSLALQILKEPGVLPKIRALFGSDRASVREQAVMVMGAIGSSRDDSSSVRALLRDSESKVRASAMITLKRMGDYDAFDDIAEFLTNPDDNVRSKALAALEDFAQKGGLTQKYAEALAKGMEQSSGQVRNGLLVEAAKLGAKELGPILSRMVTDSEPMVRAHAIMGIGKINSPEYAQLILDRFEAEREYWPRVQLAGAAQAMKLDGALDKLIEWLSDEDTNIRAAALRALRGITRLNLGVERDIWQDWRDKTRLK